MVMELTVDDPSVSILTHLLDLLRPESPVVTVKDAIILAIFAYSLVGPQGFPEVRHRNIDVYIFFIFFSVMNLSS